MLYTKHNSGTNNSGRNGEVFKMSKSRKQLKSKKKFIIFFTILAALGAIADARIISILRARYVFVGWETYEKDMTCIDIDSSWKEEMALLKRVNEFNKLKELNIYHYEEADLNQFKLQNKTLKQLQIDFTDLRDVSFLNSIPSLEYVGLYDGIIDLCSINNKNVSEIEFVDCEIKNLGMLKRCSSLKSLLIYACSFDGLYIKNDNLVLRDSTIFSELDSIVDLDLDDEDLKIKDVNGFLKMNSLKKIIISKNCMTRGQIDKLESAGIQVEISEE